MHKGAWVPDRRPKVRKVYTVEAVWDAEAGVYFSDSDISGLHIEAKNLEEFEREVFKLAPDLIEANHMTDAGVHSDRAKDRIPALVYRAMVA
jgi:hypothetical protein